MNIAMRQRVRWTRPAEERTARARGVSRPHEMSGPLEYKMTPSNQGFLLLDGFLRPIYASPGALEILRYRESPKRIKSLDRHLGAKIQSLLIKNASSPKSGFVDEFVSGRRHYSCRAFVLNASSNPSGEARTVALLLERSREVPLESHALARAG